MTWRSVPQTPQNATSTLTWLSPHAGSGTSRMSRFPSPGAYFTRAFMDAAYRTLAPCYFELRGTLVNPLATLGLGMGSAWLSGVNLYATVLTLGLVQRFGLVQLPGDLEFISRTWVIAPAAALYAVEFLADKIPVVDSIWDAIHTFIRIPAGAVMAASAFANFDPSVRAAAMLAGGTLALGSHGTKASMRVAANT